MQLADKHIHRLQQLAANTLIIQGWTFSLRGFLKMVSHPTDSSLSLVILDLLMKISRDGKQGFGSRFFFFYPLFGNYFCINELPESKSTAGKIDVRWKYEGNSFRNYVTVVKQNYHRNISGIFSHFPTVKKLLIMVLVKEFKGCFMLLALHTGNANIRIDR